MATIIREIERADSEIINQLRRIPPSDFGHRINFQLIGSRLVKPVYKIKQQFAGSAITVRIPPNDSVMVYKALEFAKPGDVIVIDMSGDKRYACWGEITTRVAQAKGVVAAIVNGPVTDSAEIEELGFNVYATGLSPLTTKLHGIDGDINVPVAIDDVVIYPGDIVVGNNDGILVVPRDEGKKYLQIGKEECEADRQRKDRLAAVGADEYIQALDKYLQTMNINWK
ncbi:RraA family protein [Brevibacillus marinus]|uniref:RraA family protein n=1 Tax=Brevibacillus marinus TaxID=2496837 RepID=UPI000F842B8A|nr:RraA family protein [Brevibacillus marinus]